MALKSCVICGKHFDSQGDTCLSCLLKPSRETSIDIKQSHATTVLNDEKASKDDDFLKEDDALKEDKISNENKILKENTVNSLTTKERACIDCGKMYSPTGNCQKRCPECGDKYAKNYKKISNSKSNAARSKSISKPAVAPVAKAAEIKPETKPEIKPETKLLSGFVKTESSTVPELVQPDEPKPVTIIKAAMQMAPDQPVHEFIGKLTQVTPPPSASTLITVEIGNVKITISQ